MEDELLVAFRRRPSADTDVRQFGIQLNYLVESRDSGGRLAMTHYQSSPGHEPPPHVHDDEHEIFYILEGEIDAYCGGSILHASAGDCLFLPLGVPHAWLIHSAIFSCLIVTAPALTDQAFRALKVYEDKNTYPNSATYAEALSEQEMERDISDIMSKFGVRILTPQEIAREMPKFPTKI